MFDQKLDTKIVSCTPRVIDDNDQIRRVCDLVLGYEYTDDIAGGLGDVGKDALKHLRSGAAKSTTILMDALKLSAVFEAGAKDKHTLSAAVGVRAAVAKPNKEDASPTLRFHLSFATRHEDLCWMADHIGETVKATLQKTQLDLVK